MAKAKILGKLKGIIASAKEPSRNGRKYTERFWDSIFDRDLFREGLENKVFFGQLYHPDDDEEYNQVHCDDRSAIVLTDVKKKGLDYEGTFEILPTKAGQCLRNLLDIGCIFGVSSRGLSDYDTDVFDESIAPTYDLITWDIVAFPGVKSCRLHEVSPVAESFKVRKNKVRIMENLNTLSANNEEMKSYIYETLKAKEDFEKKQNIYDVMSKYDISTDLIDYANVVEFDEHGIPYHDGEQGRLEVYSPYSTVIEKFGPGDMCIVDNITYKNNAYIATGDWIKINEKAVERG